MEDRTQIKKAGGGNLLRSRNAVLVITVTVVLMLIIILAVSSSLGRTLASNSARTEQLEELIKAEQERTQEIRDLQEYMQSDEYLEKAAKEKLGFVKDGEIIYKESK